MGAKGRMSPAELTKLSDTDVCHKLSIAECLKPAPAGSVGAINNTEKAALQDFYATTALINPCIGEAIDKDAIFKAMCEKGEVSMSGLDEATDQYLCGYCDISYVKCDTKNDGICPESFIMHPVGAALTCQINSAKFNYTWAHNQFIHVGDICIQVSKYNDSGENVSYDSPELLADAWNSAMTVTAAEFAAFDHTLTSSQYKELFLENLRMAVDQKFSSFSISSGKCYGNIRGSNPKYSLLCF